MWSIWFYFMPGATAFEAVGYETEADAQFAADNSIWFKDEGRNTIRITHSLSETAVIKICETI
jgi:hypothetical protein